MNVVIIDYGAGNLRSVQYALERLGVTAICSADPGTICAADKVIFPGVGHAKTAMEQLSLKGLDKLIPQLKQPVLGICLGMQLLCRKTEEGEQLGLGLIDAVVRKFPTDLKVPHMGWNQFEQKENPLLASVPNKSWGYFIHSYFVPTGDYTVASCDYGLVFSALVQSGNFYGVQFHPEKSSGAGLTIIKNFLNLPNKLN